ncbi:MAG: HAD-IC family P-type ATPase, partial [Methanobacterium sp.]|nr:HAD-IC family P-type ATPase [Methanobacterium sp.]
MADKINWYQISAEETFKKLNTNIDGLTKKESSKRLEKYGYNEIEFKKPSPFRRLLKQLNNPLIYLLILVSIITAFLGEWVDTVVILGVVIVNTAIGFIQEGKAESSIEALEKMMVPECTVIRNGDKKKILARELAIGDVVLLESGSQVPADLRLFRSKNLNADEAALTGESVPVTKGTESIAAQDLPPADQKSMAFGGTFITQGSGGGIVVATGEYTEMGKIAEIMKGTQEIMTPLTRKMEEFTKVIVMAILLVALVNFALSAWFGFGLIYSFMASASLAVAAIPEGLPAVLTVTLALGVKAMAKRNALIRKLPSVESLGRTTVICSDKTGTLTKNQMTVVRIFSGGKTFKVTGSGYDPQGDITFDNKPVELSPENKELKYTLKAGLLCNNASLVEKKGFKVIGDPTEGSLIVSAAKADLTDKTTRLDEVPFESKQRYMATLHQGLDENIIYVKGSPEKIIKRSRNQLIKGEITDLQEDEIYVAANSMAKDALRVLGFAYKVVDEHKTEINLDDIKDLTFLGLQGMIDPPREEVIDAIKKSKSAGIRTVMITGDHAKTAKAIAKQLGIGSKKEKVITGKEISRMSPEELYEIVDKVSIFARVAP